MKNYIHLFDSHLNNVKNEQILKISETLQEPLIFAFVLIVSMIQSQFKSSALLKNEQKSIVLATFC